MLFMHIKRPGCYGAQICKPIELIPSAPGRIVAMSWILMIRRRSPRTHIRPVCTRSVPQESTDSDIRVGLFELLLSLPPPPVRLYPRWRTFCLKLTYAISTQTYTWLFVRGSGICVTVSAWFRACCVYFSGIWVYLWFQRRVSRQRHAFENNII